MGTIIYIYISCLYLRLYYDIQLKELSSLRSIVLKRRRLRYFKSFVGIGMNHPWNIIWWLKFKSYIRKTFQNTKFFVSSNIYREIRLVAVVRRLTVFFVVQQIDARYKSRETIHEHNIILLRLHLFEKQKLHRGVIVNYRFVGWFIGVNVWVICGQILFSNQFLVQKIFQSDIYDKRSAFKRYFIYLSDEILLYYYCPVDERRTIDAIYSIIK